MKLWKIVVLFLLLVSPVYGAGKLPNRHPTYWEAYKECREKKLALLAVFVGPGCVPCEHLKQIIYTPSLWNQLTKKISIYFVDVSKEPDVAEFYKKNEVLVDDTIPVLVMFYYGCDEIINRHFGTFKDTQEFGSWYNSPFKKQSDPKPQPRPYSGGG